MVYTGFTYTALRTAVSFVLVQTRTGRCSLNPALIARRRGVKALLCFITIDGLEAPILTSDLSTPQPLAGAVLGAFDRLYCIAFT